MDFASMMNNPMVGGLMERLQSDPELMQLISSPEMMAKLQQMSSNPAAAQQMLAADPQLQYVVQRMMGGGGGGGGGIGGSQTAAANPWASLGSSSSSSSGHPSYIAIHSASQYHQVLKSAGPNKLVVVDFTATWCAPCKKISPVFDELSSSYKDKVVFVKVDGDENRELAQQQGVTGFPTFFFIVNEKKVDFFSGADERRLRAIVTEYAEKANVKVCPYKHFPVKDVEQVKYADMKWEAVESKLNEYNQKMDASNALTPIEVADLDVVIQKLQNKTSYHSATFTPAQYAIINKLLHWPLECVGPPLNILRIFVLHPHAAQTYSTQITDKAVTAMLAIRVLTNFFSRRVLSLAVAARCEEVLDCVFAALKRLDDENLRSSALALYINHTLLFNEDHQFYEAGKVQLLSSLPEHFTLPNLNPKLLYRMLVILGSLVYEDSNTTELANALELPSVVQQALNGVTDTAVQEAAAEVLTVLKQTK